MLELAIGLYILAIGLYILALLIIITYQALAFIYRQISNFWNKDTKQNNKEKSAQQTHHKQVKSQNHPSDVKKNTTKKTGRQEQGCHFPSVPKQEPNDPSEEWTVKFEAINLGDKTEQDTKRNTQNISLHLPGIKTADDFMNNNCLKEFTKHLSMPDHFHLISAQCANKAGKNFSMTLAEHEPQRDPNKNWKLKFILEKNYSGEKIYKVIEFAELEGVHDYTDFKDMEIMSQVDAYIHSDRLAQNIAKHCPEYKARDTSKFSTTWNLHFFIEQDGFSFFHYQQKIAYIRSHDDRFIPSQSAMLNDGNRKLAEQLDIALTSRWGGQDFIYSRMLHESKQPLKDFSELKQAQSQQATPEHDELPTMRTPTQNPATIAVNPVVRSASRPQQRVQPHQTRTLAKNANDNLFLKVYRHSRESKVCEVVFEHEFVGVSSYDQLCMQNIGAKLASFVNDEQKTSAATKIIADTAKTAYEQHLHNGGNHENFHITFVIQQDSQLLHVKALDIPEVVTMRGFDATCIYLQDIRYF